MIPNLLKSSKNHLKNISKIRNNFNLTNQRHQIILISSNNNNINNNNIIKSLNSSILFSNQNKNNNNICFNNNNKRYYSIKPTHNENLISKASELINESRFEEAIKLLNTAIEIQPLDANAYALRADTLEFLGRYDEAILDYEKILGFLPQSIPCYSSLASCFYNKGEIDRAIRYFEQILIIDPNYIPANGFLGDIYLKKGDLSKSLEYYKNVLRIQPESVIGLVGLGCLALKQNNKKDATKIFRQVIKLGEGKPISFFQTSVSTSGGSSDNNNSGNYYQNDVKFKGSIDSNPIYIAHVSLAHIYYNELNAVEALKQFNKVIEYNPNNSNALALASTLKQQDGQLGEALETIDKSLELDPSSEFSKSIKADILYDLERFEEAVPLFKELLAGFLQGENPDPEKALPRLSVLHNLILSYAHLSAQFPQIIDFNEISQKIEPITEMEQLSKTPETLFELNASCRHWVKFFQRLSQSVYISGTVQREFSDLMLEFFQSIALAASEIVQINHREMQNQSENPILSKDDEMEKMLFEYYTDLTFSILNNNNNNNNNNNDNNNDN
ncbi:hypothetical protein DDB_G0278327 [Dictyostelium discoideum AX4]|uniref:Uncharacterized protein n=1 Tax=Dictyostelium discoideum TaxID=44689 RepID=Q54YA9_DICDI|nr:hypothetical protein DDB_G0278327 [Dictyostelium discoideum AX4]EAL68336.1 hypothetical protein DDB_G0278327 [Dictyostelium discoideum AX4]|eukprot:XP_642293.1 hypothetical protein DDB_G0278327 [Dictyostelium discoideum AX4]